MVRTDPAEQVQEHRDQDTAPGAAEEEKHIKSETKKEHDVEDRAECLADAQIGCRKRSVE